MAFKIEFENYAPDITKRLNTKVYIALEECAGELESAVKRNTRVDTGQLKNNWVHWVNPKDYTAYVGNSLENAIWEEFGTGEHALKGNGRQGGWRYKDAKGDWHFTRGKKPQRALHKAFNSTRKAIVNHIQEVLKGL